MATPIGGNAITALSRRYIVPKIYDQFYRSNVFFFRMVARNKRLLQGGTQIEVPVLYTGFAAGGPYQGYDVLDVSPSDTIKNAAWDWKQLFSPVSVSGLDLIRADSPEAIVNFLSAYFENAQMDIADKAGSGLMSDGVTNTKAIDGIKGAVDDGTVMATYGGLLRSANTWWKSQIDATAYSGGSPITLKNMQTLFMNCTEGGRHPTIGVTVPAVYNIYWNLAQSNQNQQALQPGGQDEILAQNGFTNLLFNNVPLVVDSHVPTTSPGNHLFWLNEDYFTLYVNSKADFRMNEFREPVNQDAMTSLILWAGNLICSNPARQGKHTNVGG